MQIKGKLFTIAGIVLIFGYFILDSIKNPTSQDPTAIVIVGGDTLGRDWGALADQREREQQLAEAGLTEPKEEEIPVTVKPLISEQEDPYTRNKINSSNYSTIQDASGREVITGYNREEQQEDQYRYQTRHQRENGEPAMIYSSE